MKQKFFLRYFLNGWVALGFATIMGAGCSSWPNSQEVKPGVAVNEVFLTVPDSLKKSAWMQTFLWTVKCEATGGQICEGAPKLLLPPDKKLCRFEHKVMEGTEGNTDQSVMIENDSSLKVKIRAIGGPEWKPYKSKIVLQVTAVGIASEVDEETRNVLKCKSFSAQK